MSFRFIGSFTLAVVFAACATVALSWAVADIKVERARSLLKKLEERGQLVELPGWDEARDDLETAQRLHPGRPDTLDALASMESWRNAPAPTDDPEAQTARKKELSYYRSSLRARPVYSYAWANLALEKYRLREIDGEFASALRNASELGLGSTSVQLAVTKVGLVSWPLLDMATREAVLAAVRRGLRQQKAKLLETVKAIGRYDMLCLLHKH